MPAMSLHQASESTEFPESIRYPFIALRRVVDRNWEQEGSVGCDEMRAIYQLPLKARIALEAVMGVREISV